MRLGQIALKIRAAALADFGNRVLGASEFALLKEYTLDSGSLETAFVIPLAEVDNGDNQYDTSVNQIVKERFGIVVTLRNDTDTTKKMGLAAFDRLHNVRQALFGCLLGWLPPGAERLIYYKGGKLLDINPAWLWYQFEFQQETRITTANDGIDQSLGPFDDFLRVYTQWLVGDASQGVLPMSGPPPVLPESLQPPDMTTMLSIKPEFDDGFSPGFETVEGEGNAAIT